MKKITYFFLLILMSCSSSKVLVDYDDEINFSDFRNYTFYDDIAKNVNDLDKKRIKKAISVELNQKGFNESNTPDFYINVISKLSENQQNNTIGIGVGSGGVNGGFGISGGIPIGGKKLSEEFIIEFVNAKTDKIFWEGVLHSTVKEKRKPEEKQLHFQEIIKKILANYPPK